MDVSIVVLLGVTALSAVGLTWVLRPGRGASRAVSRLWTALEVGFGLFLMLGMFYAATIQVMARYALADYLTLPWTEEFARLLLVWATFWGAAIVQRTDEHLNMAIVFDLLPPGAQLVVRLAGEVVVVAILALAVWEGWRWAGLQMTQTTITLGVPIAAFAYSVPVGGGLMIVYSLGLALRRIREGRSRIAGERGV